VTNQITITIPRWLAEAHADLRKWGQIPGSGMDVTMLTTATLSIVSNACALALEANRD
jgi:hypothetical protein